MTTTQSEAKSLWFFTTSPGAPWLLAQPLAECFALRPPLSAQGRSFHWRGWSAGAGRRLRRMSLPVRVLLNAQKYCRFNLVVFVKSEEFLFDGQLVLHSSKISGEQMEILREESHFKAETRRKIVRLWKWALRTGIVIHIQYKYGNQRNGIPRFWSK